jgi:hypothetical protein
MKSGARVGRGCSRVSCRAMATMTLTYIYSDSTAVLGPLATFSEPHSYDLCAQHSARMTVPNGWNVIRQSTDSQEVGPSEDDLMAIADAVREVAAFHQEESALAQETSQSVSASSQNVGRRGHLRAVPS